MPVLDILYKLGDAVAAQLGQCEDEVTVDSWHGYWVGLATQSITLPREQHERIVNNMVAALGIAFKSLHAARQKVGG